MSSYWTPFSPSRESDYYRPNVTLNLDRPPRPGPRQPDCWRPAQMTFSSQIHIKEEDFSQSPELDNEKQTGRPYRDLNPCKRVTDLTYIESANDPETQNAGKKRKVKVPKPPNPNKEPPARLRGGFSGSFYNGAKFQPETDQFPLGLDHNNSVASLNIDTKGKGEKVKAPRLGNPNLEQLGKRQMGVINSIMKVEEQKVDTTKPKDVRDNQLTIAETDPLTIERHIRSEEANEDRLSSIPTTDYSPPSPPENHERPPCRRLPYPRDIPLATTQWSRTMISADLTNPVSTFHSPPANDLLPQNGNPGRRQKLDFGNRIDQCLLKMDKWADAWLSNALIDEDPTPDTDNAWNSFEYCLGMPDVLEKAK